MPMEVDLSRVEAPASPSEETKRLGATDLDQDGHNRGTTEDRSDKGGGKEGNGKGESKEQTVEETAEEEEHGAGVYEEVKIEDMEYNEEEDMYTYSCPCGDLFFITSEDLAYGEDIARCPSCSLIVGININLTSLCRG
ncbi:hypothetical protein AAMO2058_000464700 [Amorphochlora amoebiformis]